MHENIKPILTILFFVILFKYFEVENQYCHLGTINIIYFLFLLSSEVYLKPLYFTLLIPVTAACISVNRRLQSKQIKRITISY